MCCHRAVPSSKLWERGCDHVRATGLTPADTPPRRRYIISFGDPDLSRVPTLTNLFVVLCHPFSQKRYDKRLWCLEWILYL